jgi:hypothetical protein
MGWVDCLFLGGLGYSGRMSQSDNGCKARCGKICRPIFYEIVFRRYLNPGSLLLSDDGEDIGLFQKGEDKKRDHFNAWNIAIEKVGTLLSLNAMTLGAAVGPDMIPDEPN